MNINIPRVLIAGTQSGSGKTTVTCAVLQLLLNKNLKAASFKCGPDYIDPMFHSKVIGAKSRNLDAFFCGDDTIKYLLGTNSEHCDISIIEGVMGFYDGLNLNTDKASSYDLAKITATPVILTVNCKGLANSAIAIIKGFKELKSDSNIKGVILNNITQNTFQSVKSHIEEYFKGEIEVIGYLPRLPEELVLKSRHLGLVTANEVANLKENMQKLAEIARETIDIDALVALARTALPLSFTPLSIKKKQTVKIGVALDKACCFYYSDNLDLLQKMGAELVFFSPLEDKQLPNGIHGLYIGGGYPELYLEKLSKNETLKTDLKNAIDGKIPLVAECGGFMYLTKAIDTKPMVGAISADCYNTNHLSHFGYVTMTAAAENPFCQIGQQIKAHEFHYYDSTDNGGGFEIAKQNGSCWQGVFTNKNQYAGYPHIHFFQDIRLAESFYDRCVERKNQNA
ncbi:MAG: cobyrinate a,c-diamide synthase [Oscillospiraceae bacterium]